jgi:ADP-heptose:LPS heptosyltransferase
MRKAKITNAPKVLVFAECGIGDLILGTPLFSSIRTALPGSRITVVLRPDIPREVLNENRDVETVLRYPQKSVLYFFPRVPVVLKNIFTDGINLAIELAFIFKLKFFRFDASMHLCPGGATGTALVTFLCGAKIRVGPAFKHRLELSKWCYTHTVTWDNFRHVVENNLDNLRVLGFNKFDTSLKLFVNNADRQKARDIFTNNSDNASTPLVGLHTGGGNSGKPYWPLDRFVRVARYLIENAACRVAAFFGPQEPDALTAFEDAPVIPIVNMSIGVVFGIIEKCSLFISSDTGLGHAAAAFQVPTLTLFGNGNQRKHEHWGNKNYAINKLPEAILTGYETGYSAGEAGKQALERISVDEVIALLKNIFVELKVMHA